MADNKMKSFSTRLKDLQAEGENYGALGQILSKSSPRSADLISQAAFGNIQSQADAIVKKMQAEIERQRQAAIAAAQRQQEQAMANQVKEQAANAQKQAQLAQEKITDQQDKLDNIQKPVNYDKAFTPITAEFDKTYSSPEMLKAGDDEVARRIQQNASIAKDNAANPDNQAKNQLDFMTRAKAWEGAYQKAAEPGFRDDTEIMLDKQSGERQYVKQSTIPEGLGRGTVFDSNFRRPGEIQSPVGSVTPSPTSTRPVDPTKAVTPDVSVNPLATPDTRLGERNTEVTGSERLQPNPKIVSPQTSALIDKSTSGYQPELGSNTSVYNMGQGRTAGGDDYWASRGKPQPPQGPPPSTNTLGMPRDIQGDYAPAQPTGPSGLTQASSRNQQGNEGLNIPPGADRGIDQLGLPYPSEAEGWKRTPGGGWIHPQWGYVGPTTVPEGMSSDIGTIEKGIFENGTRGNNAPNGDMQNQVYSEGGRIGATPLERLQNQPDTTVFDVSASRYNQKRGLGPPNEDEKNIIGNAVAAFGRGDENAAWVAPVLIHAAQMAYAKEKPGELRPESAPPDYVKSWIGAFYNGDNVPMANELHDDLARMGISARPTMNYIADRPLKGITPNQLTDAEVDRNTALALCGPAAMVAFMRAHGHEPGTRNELREAMEIAKTGGWNPGSGMGRGSSGWREAMASQGIKTTEGPPDEAKMAQEINEGRPVVVNFAAAGQNKPGHYFVAEGYDPKSGRFDFGNSAKVLTSANGRTEYTLDELRRIPIGNMQSAIYMAPESQARSPQQSSTVQAMFTPGGDQAQGQGQYNRYNYNGPVDVSSHSSRNGTQEGEIEDFVTRAAQARGLDPGFVNQLVDWEGGHSNPVKQNNGGSSAFGPLQMMRGGGLGGAFEKYVRDHYGVDADVRNPKYWKMATEFGLDAAVSDGSWRQWEAATKRGVQGQGFVRPRKIGFSDEALTYAGLK